MSHAMQGSTRARAWTGPTLVTLCLLLLYRKASSFNLTLDDLPPTRQHTKRLLAAITVNEAETHHFVTKQLHSYAEACEAGFEVHVVLVTFPGVWDNADKTLFPTASTYHCMRLQMLLPVVLFPRVPSLPIGLAYNHRYVFSQLSHKYDLFLSQEHDMDVRLRHLRYWTHWRHFFMQHPVVPRSAKPIVPGFLRAEVSTRKQQGNLWLQPTPLIHFDSPISIIDIGNVTCFAPEKAYPGFYLIDRQMLQLAMSKQAWTTDATKDFPEFNTHHQHHWQWYYFLQAIPLPAAQKALVHHGSDRYAPAFIEKSATYTNDHFRDEGSNSNVEGQLDVVELEYMVANCMGQRWDAASLPFPYPSLRGRHTVVGYGACRGWIPKWLPRWFHALSGCLGYNPDPKGGKGPTPCAQCASEGKGSALVYKLSGPTLAAQPLKPKGLFLAEVACISTVPDQMLVRCRNAGCDDYFVNATKPDSVLSRMSAASATMKQTRKLIKEDLIP